MKNRVVLSFSPLAQVEWEQIYNEIEYAIRPGGEFCKTRDYASKVAENIARLAGVFHAFEGFEGTKISVDTLRAAAHVVLWYTREFVRLFTPPGPLDVIRNHALVLDQWLVDYVRASGMPAIYLTDLLQLGPNKLRKREILNIAIGRLIETNRAWYGVTHQYKDGRISAKGFQLLYLNDSYYGQLARGHQPSGFLQL